MNLKSIVVIALLIAACEPTVTATTVQELPDVTRPVTTITSIELELPVTPPQPPLIDIVAGGFVHRQTGGPFVPRGVDYFLIKTGEGGPRDRFFSPGVSDGVDILEDFQALADRGYNTVRIFLDGCSIGPDCISQRGVPGLNRAYLGNVAATMRVAEATGLVLILTSNDLPDGGGYRDMANRDNSDAFPGYRNSDFLTTSGHEAMKTYWHDLLTELVDLGAPFEVVLGWSILNEHWLFTDQPPLSLTSGEVTTAAGTYDMTDATSKRAMVVDTTRQLIADVAGVIRSIHPEANVTMGFFAPQFPNPTHIGGDWYVDTAPLVENSDLDFFDFHLYTGEDITDANAGENFGITDAKPVVMGEYGAFVSRNPTPANLEFTLRQHVAESCLAGWDGWIHWGYLRAPLDDATWALTDNGGALLDVLSPRFNPDPCEAPENPNLAANAIITATATLSGSDPANVADGTAEIWNSGVDAPQSITIDLGARAAISAIEMIVEQFPAGRTIHRLQWAVTEGDFNEGITFDGVTESGDVLEAEWGFERPTMRYVRITTSTSPSWVAWGEVSISGVFVP